MIIITLYPPNYKNRQSPKHIKYTTWDIETDYPINPKKVLMIGFFNGEQYKKWDFQHDNDEIFDLFLGEVLKKQYYGYSHYAHFGGKFDFIYMLDTLKKYDYNFNIIDVNGRILSIEVFKNYDAFEHGKYCEFRDSFALMPKSLKDITQSFSDRLTYIKLNHEFEENDKSKEIDNFCCLKHNKINCFDCYLESDVKSLYQSLGVFEEIINTHNGELKLTIASTALDIFKNGYLKTILNSLHNLEIGQYHTGEKQILNTEEIIRQYYFGGRTEIFKRYIEYGHYYDINSLYPFVMLQKMPISQPFFVSKDSINYQKDIGFVYCDNIEFWRNDIIPLIPYKLKLKYSTKLVYPVGKWNGWLDLDMYRKAIQIGYKLNVKYGIIFNGDEIFKDYINDFYELRFMNDAMGLIAKLLMNSLYGKFAQKTIKKNIIKFLGCSDKEFCKNKCPHRQNENHEQDIKGECVLIPYNLDEMLFQLESESKSKHIIPSISAHITTLAQLELYKLIERCNHDVAYCDTDSIVSNVKLSSSKKLGDIKQEYEIDRGVFLLPKTYCFEGFDLKKQEHITKITMKGFIKNQFNFDDFYNAMIKNDYSKFNYNVKKIWGFKESIKRNNTFLTYDDKINSIKTGYDKRIILDDNINTKPLTINDGIVIK